MKFPTNPLRYGIHHGNTRVGGLLAALLLLLGVLPAAAAPRAEAPPVVLRGVPFTLTVTDPDLLSGESREVRVRAGEETHVLSVAGGVAAELTLRLAGNEPVVLLWEGGGESVVLHRLPGWTSLLPPLLAILLAVLFRQVLIALLVGIWLGAWLVLDVDPGGALLHTFDVYVVGALADSDHVSILAFSFLMGGMLGIIHKSGGTAGIVTLLAPAARTARGGQLATWFLGLVIFFDDYANSLLVGNTMRPITDRLRISREKLAYLVDSTAAPVAGVAVISSWIGVEVGLIAGAFEEVGIETDAYAAFLGSLPYRFYPFFALVFGFLVASTGRDFGPMLRAERRARERGEVLRPGAVPLADFESAALAPAGDRPGHWLNAALPILVLVSSVLAFLYTTGRAGALAAGDPLDLRTIAGHANSYSALLWGSVLGSVTALLAAVLPRTRTLSLGRAVEAWVQGAKSIFMAALILTLAWSLGALTSEMGTASYLVELLGGVLDARWVPFLVFLLAGATSFSTGSSWSTMGILMPLVVPLIHQLAPGNETLLAGTISSVLAGAVWGDHCSPISDTTVLSSMASSSDHVDHVNTQLPYALIVGLVGLVLGDLATGFGVPVWLSWILGLGVLVGVVWGIGRKVPEVRVTPRAGDV